MVAETGEHLPPEMKLHSLQEPNSPNFLCHVPGFKPLSSFDARPVIVYACPPHVCGGTLNWLKWQVANCDDPRDNSFDDGDDDDNDDDDEDDDDGENE
eukprot:147257-Hanusia_phi.AAC.2